MKNAPAPEDDGDEPEKEMSFAKEIGLLILGAALIAVGANLLVDNGTLIAQALGVPVLTEQEFLAMLQDAPAEPETT